MLHPRSAPAVLGLEGLTLLLPTSHAERTKTAKSPDTLRIDIPREGSSPYVADQSILGLECPAHEFRRAARLTENRSHCDRVDRAGTRKPCCEECESRADSIPSERAQAGLGARGGVEVAIRDAPDP